MDGNRFGIVLITVIVLMLIWMDNSGRLAAVLAVLKSSGTGTGSGTSSGTILPAPVSIFDFNPTVGVGSAVPPGTPTYTAPPVPGSTTTI